MDTFLKHRITCVGLFIVANIVYLALVLEGIVTSTIAILYAFLGIVWSHKLRKSRHKYRQHIER